MRVRGRNAVILAAVWFLFLQSNALLAEGFGLRAGPFEFVLETEEPVDDFVITLSSLHTYGEGNIFPGGGYHKITHGASNTVIRFPRGALYDWKFAGNRGVSGMIEHPQYLRTGITIAPTGDDEKGVEASTDNLMQGRQMEIVSPDKPIRIQIKMVKTADYIKHLEDEPVVDSRYKAGLSDDEWQALSENERKAYRRLKIWESNTYLLEFFEHFLALGQADEKIEKYGPYFREFDSLYFIENKRLSEKDNDSKKQRRSRWLAQFLSPKAEETLKTPKMVNYPYEYIKQK